MLSPVAPAAMRQSLTSMLPAPVRGWDAATSIASMKGDSAIQLVNMFPEERYVTLRKGFSVHATGMPSRVESVMAWQGPTGKALFSASGSSIYAVTSAGTVGAAAVSSLTSAQWQSCNFSTSGGNFLFAVNGADAPRHFNGTTWATPTITGIGTPANLITVVPHKRRLWMTEYGTTKGWYLGTEAIAGAATAFDFGPLFSRGGPLWTIGTLMGTDTGQGPDDLLVAISSEGQAAVYSGTDPATADTWALVGVYDMPRPLSRRCLAEIGGDLAVITDQGIVSMRQIIRGGDEMAINTAYTAGIRDAFVSATERWGGNYGWEFTPYPSGRMAILNVPESSTRSSQYVMNLLTGAWCKFTGQYAACFRVLEDKIYFGGDGIVYRGNSGESDAGSAINWQVQWAFNAFGKPGIQKHFKLVRPLIETTGSVTPRIKVNVDYDVSDPTGASSYSAGSKAKWNQVKWNEFVWNGAYQAKNKRFNVGGSGTVGAVNIKGTALNMSLRIASVEVVYGVGGIL